MYRHNDDLGSTRKRPFSLMVTALIDCIIRCNIFIDTASDSELMSRTQTYAKSL